jgi:tetratricopeptide (TPR) repeat protein
MQRKLLGEQHPDIASSLNNLAQVLRERARLTEAETMFRDALAMRKKLLRDDHPDVTASLFDLARVLHDQRKLAEAEASIRECLAIRERHSPDDWQTFDARSLLGGLLLDQKKSTEAEPLLQSGFAGMKQREDKIPAPFKARLKETTDCLLQLYEAQGQPDKAAEWKKKFGPPTASPQATSPAPTKQR